MKTKKMLIPLFIFLIISPLHAQTYSPADSAALVAIDNNCDTSDSLNWDFESDPGKWTGVTWNNSAPKRVSKITADKKKLQGVLDVSPLSEMDTLYCNYNQLTGLNISGLTNLNYLSCYVNLLTSLNASGLINLQTLWCYNNQLSNLNISGLTNLQYLDCCYNQLTSLNVSGLTNLQNIKCSNNLLDSLVISDQDKMQYFDCSNNKLTRLNVSGDANLRSLICYYNQLTSLEVSGDTSLRTLNCFSNQLTSLDVTGMNNLRYLYCDTNRLGTLSVTGLTNLYYLRCTSNQLTSLDVSGLTNLLGMYCSSNQLTSLDASGLTNLSYLDCSSNKLTGLGASGLINLQKLNCSFNQLTSLDVSNLTNLEILDCSYNRLNYLDASMLVKVNPLHCEHNRLPFSSLAKRSNSNYFDNPQDTLFTPLTIASIYTIDYSAEALIKSTKTNFEFYKNDTLVATNTTGLYTTKGPGVYYCKMTNSWIGALILVTAHVTLTNDIPALSVSPSVLDIASGANSAATFTIISNTDWNVVSSEAWLTISAASGSNNGAITLTATENPGTTARTATVTISGAGVLSQTITVTQAVNNTTAVNELSYTEGFVYPNPVNDLMNINLVMEDLPATICIYNIEGRLLKLIRTNHSLTEIAMEGYAPEVYILRINTPVQILEKKIIKQ